MKTLLLLATLILSSIATQAQSNNVLTAYLKLQEDELTDARMHIEAAMEHVKTSEQAKTWYYAGKIYMAIYDRCGKTDGTFEKYPADYYVGLAKHAYYKATTYDLSRIDENQLMREYQITADYMLNEGVKLYNYHAYKRAALMFEGTILIKEDFDIVDSLAIYNAALAHEKAGNSENAIKFYLTSAEMGYNGAQAYHAAILILKEEGTTEEATTLLKTAREAYPNNIALLTTEINMLLQTEAYDKALFTIDQAIVQTPDNADLHYTRGYLLESSYPEEAIAAYKKAIELNPEHVNAMYNLGAAYYNKAVELRNANGATMETGREELKQAREYLKSVASLSPGIEEVQTSLTMIKKILQE